MTGTTGTQSTDRLPSLVLASLQGNLPPWLHLGQGHEAQPWGRCRAAADGAAWSELQSCCLMLSPVAGRGAPQLGPEGSPASVHARCFQGQLLPRALGPAGQTPLPRADLARRAHPSHPVAAALCLRHLVTNLGLERQHGSSSCFPLPASPISAACCGCQAVPTPLPGRSKRRCENRISFPNCRADWCGFIS